MLMGAYLFLGSEALLPQLVANVSAVGSAVTMIRSKSNELKSGRARHGVSCVSHRFAWGGGDQMHNMFGGILN